MVGGVELGGTHVVCAVGDQPGELAEVVEFPTEAPDATLARIVGFFDRFGARSLDALGVAAFGPLDFASGSISATPKLAWRSQPLRAPLAAALGVPVVLETDVNAAAIAEGRFGASAGCSSHVYVTVGTGIGVGAVVEGCPLHGLGHPELGHQRIPRAARDAFPGACPSHGDCWEGLASGQAIRTRWGVPGEALAGRAEVWMLETEYLAVGLANVVLAYSPERLVVGGGVLAGLPSWSDLRGRIAATLNGYLPHAELGDAIADYVVPPQLGANAGVVGALALALDTAGDRNGASGPA